MNGLHSASDGNSTRTPGAGSDMEGTIGAALSTLRTTRRLCRTEVAAALGIKESGLRRHELGRSKLTVSRLLQICEIMNANPIDVIGPVAPHLIGRSDETAGRIVAIVKILSTLDAPAVLSVWGVVQHFSSASKTSGSI